MDINSMTPVSGRLLNEDGGVVNVVDMLGASAAPVSGEVHDINSYAPHSGRVLGEDGMIYNLVDLLSDIDKGGNIRIEATGDDQLTVYRGDTAVVIGAENLDTGDAFIIGSDYSIYLGDAGSVIISLDGVLPFFKIGGFHYGVNRRTNLELQPINTEGVVRGTDWEANIYEGVVPRSIWTLSHRPKCAPDGMVYLSGGVWADIYIASDNGAGGLCSKHNAIPVTGTEALTWYTAVERLSLSGKRLLTYHEFVQAAMGSPQGGSNINAWTVATDRQYTGYVERAVSSVGCRDCVGNVWEWLADIIATGSGTDEWQNPMPGQGQGQLWLFGDFRALIAGGSYFNAAFAGARTVSVLNSPWNSHASFGTRGACESM